MGSNYLTWAADELRAAGINVVEVDRVSGGVIYEGPGWQKRARSSGGYSDPKGPLCVMWHHTAVACEATSRAGLLNHAINTSDGKPVANIYLWCDATCYLLAGGATNTNGKGDSKRFSRGTVPQDSMNSYAWGMEIVNDGIGGPYPQVQIDAAFVISNTMNNRIGNRFDDVMTHWGYAPTRKIDPATASAVQGPWKPRSGNSSGSWVLDDLKAECNARGTSGILPPEPEPEDEDMTTFIARNSGTGSIALVSHGSAGVGFTWIASSADADALRSLDVPQIDVSDAQFNLFSGGAVDPVNVKVQ